MVRRDVAVDIGLWRSTRGDTHPHIGVDVAWDYWPQGTHLVWEAPALVACATGGGGGSQQALFKRDLDRFLAGALASWHRRPSLGTPVSALDAWFTEVQHQFDALDQPTWVEEYQATGVAVLIRDDGAAVGNVGLDRAYRWRRDRPLEQLTVDDSLAMRSAPAQVPEWFRTSAASAWRKASPKRPDFNRWIVAPLEVAPGDVLVLASGIADTKLASSYLLAAIDREFEALMPLVGAQDLANRLGDVVTRSAERSPKTERIEWELHSRLAIAIVWVD